MSWELKLQSAPVPEFSSTTPGLIEARVANPGDYAQGGSVSLGRFVPQIPTSDQDLILIPMPGGRSRVVRDSPGRVRIQVNVDYWTPSQWEAFHRLYSSGDLVCFSPNFDQYTVFSSSFAGHESGNVAEVGKTTYTGRINGWEVFPSYSHGGDGLAVNAANTSPKLTRGMMGKAIILHGANQNYIPAVTTWSGAGGAVVTVDAAQGNNPVTASQQAHLDATGTQYLTRPTSTLSNGVRYAASIWAKGSGVVFMRATHNSGGTDEDGAQVTLSDTWQRVWVSWTQVGTSCTLTVRQYGLNEASMSLTTTACSKGYYPEEGTLAAFASVGTPCDDLEVQADMPTTEGLTFCIWYYPRSTFASSRYFFSANHGGQNVSMRLYNNTYTAFIAESSGIAKTGVHTLDAWNQIVLTMKGGSGGIVYELFLNGASIGTQARVPTNAPAITAISIGGGQGLATPSYDGFPWPIDSFRLDSRAWTAQDALDDYEIRQDDGVREFLSWAQGRYFRIAQAPGAFGGKIATSRITGQLVLDQVDHAPGGAM